tara:strand:- start:3037 stop:3300 length:264 start_codon:yes stop_codon:yes gene_type:complete
MASFRDLPSELQATIFSLNDKMESYRVFLDLLGVCVPTKLDMSLWGIEEWEVEVEKWNKDNEEEGFFIVLARPRVGLVCGLKLSPHI